MLDPYTGEAEEMSLERIERILRQRFGLIMSVQEANSFGILIGEKPGQMRRTLALRMKRMLAQHGKKGYLLALEHVGPELIDFYPVDAFVNTACPRIAIDDAVKYRKPLITPFELEVHESTTASPSPEGGEGCDSTPKSLSMQWAQASPNRTSSASR